MYSTLNKDFNSTRRIQYAILLYARIVEVEGYSITGCVRTVNILRWGKNVNKQCYPSSDHQEVRGGGGETWSTIMYTWT